MILLGAHNNKWTPEAEVELRRLVLEECKSFGQAARILQVSRSTVIGKAKRIGITSSHPPTQPGAKRRRPAPKPQRAPVSLALVAGRPQASSVPTAVPAPPKPSQPQSEGPLTIDQLTFPPCQCRWIVSDKPTLYCGKPFPVGQALSFCAEHLVRAGTVGLVADRLGLDCTLIELNPEYAEMARSRIERDAGMFAKVAAE